jgi:hypothetical protein
MPSTPQKAAMAFQHYLSLAPSHLDIWRYSDYDRSFLSCTYIINMTAGWLDYFGIGQHDLIVDHDWFTLCLVYSLDYALGVHVDGLCDGSIQKFPA